jgi:hypothetical protein
VNRPAAQSKYDIMLLTMKGEQPNSTYTPKIFEDRAPGTLIVVSPQLAEKLRAQKPTERDTARSENRDIDNNRVP